MTKGREAAVAAPSMAADIQHMPRVRDRKAAEEAVRTLLVWAGEDPDREGLLDTPKRVVDAYSELFKGYGMKAEDVLGRTFEEVGGYDDMVMVKDIRFHSHCEHHMVPFVGRIHVAYLPDGKVLGLSKIARTVEIFSSRLQTQETMTAQIADAISDIVQPRGVAVLAEAEHMCMSMRGIRQHGASTLTKAYRGEFAEDKALQAEFLSLARGGSFTCR